SRRTRAGAERLDRGIPMDAGERLGHLTAIGILDADEDDPLAHVRTARPAATVPLWEAGRGRVPSLKATAWIFSVAPFKVRVVSPVAMSQTRTVPSQLLLASCRPSPLSDRQRTDS